MAPACNATTVDSFRYRASSHAMTFTMFALIGRLHIYLLPQIEVDRTGSRAANLNARGANPLDVVQTPSTSGSRFQPNVVDMELLKLSSGCDCISSEESCSHRGAGLRIVRLPTAEHFRTAKSTGRHPPEKASAVVPCLRCRYPRCGMGTRAPQGFQDRVEDERSWY